MVLAPYVYCSPCSRGLDSRTSVSDHTPKNRNHYHCHRKAPCLQRHVCCDAVVTTVLLPKLTKQGIPSALGGPGQCPMLQAKKTESGLKIWWRSPFPETSKQAEDCRSWVLA